MKLVESKDSELMGNNLKAAIIKRLLDNPYDDTFKQIIKSGKVKYRWELDKDGKFTSVSIFDKKTRQRIYYEDLLSGDKIYG